MKRRETFSRPFGLLFQVQRVEFVDLDLSGVDMGGIAVPVYAQVEVFTSKSMPLCVTPVSATHRVKEFFRLDDGAHTAGLGELGPIFDLCLAKLVEFTITHIDSGILNSYEHLAPGVGVILLTRENHHRGFGAAPINPQYREGVSFGVNPKVPVG